MNRRNMCFINGLSQIRLLKKIRVTIVLSIVVSFIIINYHSEASSITASNGSQVNVAIDYMEEFAIVTAGIGNSTKFYFSTDKMKTWELIDPYGPIDISPYIQSKEVVLYFKGNKDSNPTAVNLQAENSSLKVTYQVVEGEGRIVFSNVTEPVEYRKGLNGQWIPANNFMLTTPYEARGTTLYFRLAATPNRRAGRIVTVRIPKKPNAPSIRLDGNKLCFTGLRNGETQYRVGDSTTWITFSPSDPKTNSLDLLQLFGVNNRNGLIQSGYIEFRTKGTDKRVSSAARIFDVTGQPNAPEAVYLNGTTLTVLDNDVKRTYEYIKLDRVSSIDMATAKWTTLKANSPVIIRNASIGDRVLVRYRSYTDPITKLIVPASGYKELSVNYLTSLN